uniref:Uncharacterized protein n=1 Tax=Panagrolaimus sp. PS1159 TaxID=55785 RepID=A0AC35GL39_9BILA
MAPAPYLFNLYPAFIQRDSDLLNGQNENFAEQFQNTHLDRLIYRYFDCALPTDADTVNGLLQQLRVIVNRWNPTERRLEFLRLLDNL